MTQPNRIVETYPALSPELDFQLTKYTRMVKGADPEKLYELFIELLRLKLGRDMYFINHINPELTLDVPSVNDPTKRHTLG